MLKQLYGYIGSEVDAISISTYLADSIDEPTGATNIIQADDNEPFNEQHDNEGNYPIVNKDNIWAFISF